MSIKQFCLFWFLLLNINIFGQSNNQKSNLENLELQVLRNSEIGKLNTFDLTAVENCNQTEIKYLGEIKTKIGKSYKVLTSFYVFKTNVDVCHGNSSIKLYDLENNYVGSFNMGMRYNLPNAINNNELIFYDNTCDCDCKTKKSINLYNGIPDSFFLECSNGLGDFYYLSK